MTTSIPDTRGKTFEDWAAGVNLAYPQADIANFRHLPWDQWARQLFQREAFDSIVVPQPERFQSWQAWGDALRQAADGLEN